MTTSNPRIFPSMKPAILSLISLGLAFLPLAHAQKSNNKEKLSPKPSIADPVEAHIQDRISRSEHATGSANRHFENGALYRRAANDFFNQGYLKRAYHFYEKAEKELNKAAEKYDKDAETKEKSDAYYQLGLVCEKIRNDKSVAAECFAKARELTPEADYLALKLSRTKEGRSKLGVRNAKDFQKMKESKQDRDQRDEETEVPPGNDRKNGLPRRSPLPEAEKKK